MTNVEWCDEDPSSTGLYLSKDKKTGMVNHNLTIVMREDGVGLVAYFSDRVEYIPVSKLTGNYLWTKVQDDIATQDP